jgi:large subunit ribosomal protein L6
MAEAATNTSRIGRLPLPLPKGVDVQVQGSMVKVKGPKGEIEQRMPANVDVIVKDGSATVSIGANAGRRAAQNQGLARALLGSMVHGAAEGYAMSLDLVGVGYRAELKGSELTLALGMSHQSSVMLPDAVKAKVETIDEAGIKRPRVHLSSVNKQALGQVAAHIRSLRPPEPYKGKGVRYTGEKVRQKAGKAAAAAGGKK